MDLLIRHLTKSEVPDGSILLWISDVHVPIHHPIPLRLAMECAEKVGVTHVIAGGDILDLHCLSSHPKDPDRILAQGTILEEVEPGRWFLNWLTTRPSILIQGNHEGRLDRFIAEKCPALYGTAAGSLSTLARLPAGIEVLPWENGGAEVRLGNLSLVHGDGEFKKSTGGQYPAHKLLTMIPDQSTICGHVHRITQARRTTTDEYGIKRTRAAFTMGHMSIEEKHYGYMSKHPNWQMGFGLIYVFWEGNRPRFEVDQVEILFDRRNRPYFSVGGYVFK